MSIQLEGKIPYTNDGWVVLFSKNREEATEKFLSQHVKYLSKPHNSPQIAKRIAYILSQMSKEIRLQHLACLDHDTIGGYLHDVLRWNDLDLEEKKLYCALSSEIENPSDALLFVDCLIDLLNADYPIDVENEDVIYSDCHISLMLLHTDKRVRDLGVKILKLHNLISDFTEVIKLSNQKYGDVYTIDDQLNDMIAEIKEGDLQTNKTVLALMDQHKEKIMDALNIDDPIFLDRHVESPLFRWVVYHYALRHGTTDIIQKMKLNTSAHDITFFEKNPILWPELNGEYMSLILRDKNDKETLSLGSMRLYYLNNKIKRCFLHIARGFSECLNQNMFILNQDAIRGNYTHKHNGVKQYGNFKETVMHNENLILLMVLSDVLFQTPLPREYQADVLIKEKYGTIDVFVEAMKDAGYKHLFKRASSLKNATTLKDYFKNIENMTEDIANEECELIL